MGSADGETFRFLLLGKTGSGKSSTGNTILGQELFDADVSFMSVTDECQLKAATNHGVTLEVMDCPGLFDTGKSNHQVARTILTAFSPPVSGFDVICYVIEIGSYSEEDYAAYQRFKAMLEKDVNAYLLLLFTHGDRLQGKDIGPALLKAPACLQNVLQDCGHRYVLFDNSSEDRQEQVLQLIQKAREIREQNGSKLFTSPSYVSSQLDTGLTSRFEDVEKTEAEKSLYVHRLHATLEKTQLDASSTTQDLARKDLEAEESSKKQMEALQQQVNDISSRLNQQQVSNSSVTSQLQALQSRLNQEQQQRQQELQQMQSQHAAAVQQKNAEIANIR